jgi:hypothetical protein
MGQTTANIGIYIPAAGETNYDASFAAGMINIDQHDHSGGPNKGVPITSSGLADDSVTYNKLNANVADNATGIGTAGSLGANQLSMLGLLKNIYQIATPAGFIAKNGSLATARTITGTADQIQVSNGDGSAGNPTLSFPTTFFEEGTFTPTLRGSVTAGSLTYTKQYGIYQRIGNWVECFGWISTSVIGVAMAGELQIAGLPFTVDNDANNIIMGQLDPCPQIVTSPTTPGGTAPFIRAIPGTTRATVLFYNPTSGSDDSYNSASWVNPDDLAFRIRYPIN